MRNDVSLAAVDELDRAFSGFVSESIDKINYTTFKLMMSNANVHFNARPVVDLMALESFFFFFEVSF